ncbi:hypothetical protein [Pseudothioclava nitratireducens]|uniref:hypothetical protein n=1 Tax=Pseudothioclava nitratireducens TaxID=1928646 RepID=UPI0023DC89EA|nr:hypothetical protein [Defluviimonas nitratireducens]MDF1619240.1 hypothetical protein [Defluviimonas nitratireducens]
MLRQSNWAPVGGFFLPMGEDSGLYPVETAMDDIGRAVRDAAFVEAAEVIARDRVAMLRQMIVGCEDELSHREGEAFERLSDTIDTLREELASLEETLPLETAFRADQRDLLRVRITDAQDRLRRFLIDPAARENAFDPLLTLDEAIERVETALSRGPDDILAAARAEASARIATAPVLAPEDWA